MSKEETKKEVKKENKSTEHVIYKDEKGNSVKVTEEVIAIIAGMTATEVEGVASMAGNITNDIVAKLGMKNLSRGVKVEMGEDSQVRVDLALNLEYEYNIMKVSKEVQEKVKTAIKNMTDLDVSVVNIRVAGVDMNQAENQ